MTYHEYPKCFLAHKTSLDSIAQYMAKGAKLHPHLYSFFMEEINTLQQKGKLSLIPKTIFEDFHFKLTQKTG